MPLTDSAIRNIKPGAKPRKVADAHGLYLLVTPNGSKLWRWKYRINGTEKLLALGNYRDVSLKEAREARDEARRLLVRSIDPSAKRKSEKLTNGNTFSAVADEFRKLKAHEQAEITQRKARQQLRDFVEPYIGTRPINDIKPADMLAVLKRIEESGALETARKTKELCGRIFRYAVATGRTERDPTQDLRGLLKAPQVINRAAITDPRRAGELLRAISGFAAQPSTVYALRIVPHVFLRPGELRAGRWSEIDWKAAMWRVPADRMKMKRPHLVPLSRQVLALLRELHAIIGDGELMFPAIGSGARPISENTLNASLRRLGYDTKTEHCAHGFRAMASSLLHERGDEHAVIELQLAHAKKDKVAGAYDRAERLGDRKKLMQRWSDYLDSLAASATTARAA